MAGIEGITNALGSESILDITVGDKKQADGKLNFSDFINDSISKLNQVSQKSGDMSNRFAAGEDLELHDVMMAMQEAEVAMKLTMQVRNKILEAYREVIRMPI